MMRPLSILSISLLLISTCSFSFCAEDNYCDTLQKDTSGSEEECAKLFGESNLRVTKNFPLISGSYCYNNGSGICKAFAGRYEFYYNSFEDKFLWSAPESRYVDKFGYHQRVPVSYTINGDILYADRSINWARRFARNELKDKKISLLSTEVVNWCLFVADNNWPYKSAIKQGQYQIYFFNRQSCIVDTSESFQPKQHFNTRFLHNSSVRIDLDMNPTIYAMEDNIANETRLVKHIRQHWYEVSFKVLKKPQPDLDYFVEMQPKDKKPCKICGGRPLLPSKAYRAFTNVCLSDDIHIRADGHNPTLFAEFCGPDKVEIADYPEPHYKNRKNLPMVLEVDLHNIPRSPTVTQSFFGVNIRSTEEWEIWAKDGLTFSAATTIPTDEENTVRVIMLYATFSIGSQTAKYEEYDPMPYIADYTARFRPISKNDTLDEARWTITNRNNAKVQAKNLNYVDDIAYLYKCKTLLVIFGPFYSELPTDKKIDLSIQGPVDSIYELGIWEPANAFFAMPDGSNTLWVYYRTNYLAEHHYDCNQPIVTAKRVSSYLQRIGPGAPPILRRHKGPTRAVYEEMLFKHVGAFKGEVSLDAPDPKDFEGAYVDPAKPLEAKDQTYIYIIIAIAILLIVIMCIICMVAVRRRIKRRRHQKTIRSGNLDDSTNPEKSQRSMLSWLPFVGSTLGAVKTQRSGMSTHSPSSKRSSPMARTVRSSSRASTPAGTTRAATTVRSPSLSSSHRGSQASLGSKHSRGSSTHRPTQRSAGSGSIHSHSGTHKPSSSRAGGSRMPSSQVKTARSAKHS